MLLIVVFKLIHLAKRGVSTSEHRSSFWGQTCSLYEVQLREVRDHDEAIPTPCPICHPFRWQGAVRQLRIAQKESGLSGGVLVRTGGDAFFWADMFLEWFAMEKWCKFWGRLEEVVDV